jgi:hypothetical protein
MMRTAQRALARLQLFWSLGRRNIYRPVMQRTALKYNRPYSSKKNLSMIRINWSGISKFVT